MPSCTWRSKPSSLETLRTSVKYAVSQPSFPSSESRISGAANMWRIVVLRPRR